MLLLELFKTFFVIGLVSFGGGYAMIPVIEREVTSRGWMTTQEFTDIIAIAGMSPGPIATNSAVFVGYQTAGIAGAVFSALGMILPSLIIILIVATFFYKSSKNRIVQSAFYGLRPSIVGLIIFAAIKFANSNHLIGSLTFYTLSLLGIFILSLYALIRLHVHPAYVIILSGLIGIALYS
ncbi:chromate transporter [Alkalihalophilus pseudofirmus]|nr:chromate transporter [Alkalihalophilus pseudofirmus]